MKSLDDQLYSLYESRWVNLGKAMKPIIEDDTYAVKPTYPLLLSTYKHVDTSFWEQADVRVMIFGQEPNGWGADGEESKIFNATIDPIKVFDTYRDWYFWSKRGGYFWNGFKLFAKKLQEKYPDKKIDFLWNDIVKIGKDCGAGLPPEYIYNVEKEHFFVVQEEVNLLKPDIILFLTGHGYDNKIEDKFGKVSFTPISTTYDEWLLAKVSLPNVPFAYRTNHPRYMYGQGKEYIHFCFDSIVSNINL
jgi:hypothetical protein